jgi:lipopolysaccharide/colanic/teichoic acid biosynthesis glycosyltransferase
MFANASGPAITIGADRRITRVGAIIRRYKLDELPQLFNVLVGEMSLVGPRPEVPKYVQCYPRELRSKIFSVRPGLTDLASLEYIDEAEVLARAADWERAYIESVLPAKLKLAARYVDQRSMGLDLQIIARTLRTLVGTRIPRS